MLKPVAAILVLVNIGIGRCSILSTPINKVVVIGQRMDMECRTTNGSIVREWTRERHSGKGTDKLFINWEAARGATNPKFPRFGVDVDGSGSGFLYSNSTEPEDAGVYICTVQYNSKLMQYSAHLIVLESKPVCETNLTAGENSSATNLWAQCSVRFRGGWEPFVKWKYHIGDQVIEFPLVTQSNGKVLSNEVRTVMASTSTITSTLTSQVESTNGAYTISFQIYFSRFNGSSISVNATNTPSYEYSWTEVVGVEFSRPKGLQTTWLSNWSEVSGMNTQTQTISSSADNISIPENGNNSLLLWLVATMATIIVAMAITAVLCFLRLRSNTAKSRFEVTSTSESHDNRASHQYSDIFPYAISDAYDHIDELNIANESTTESPMIFLPKRTALPPTPGYSSLTSVGQTVAPSVYCGMNPQVPDDQGSGSGKKLSVVGNVLGPGGTEVCLDKDVLHCEDHEIVVDKVDDSDVYLTPIDDRSTEDTRSFGADPSYLELSE